MMPQLDKVKSLFLIVAGLLGFTAALAQDTTRKREVNITSTFKPTLMEAAKINFGASPAANDTTRPVLKYDIPTQNLLFGLQPGQLKPLALEVDTGGHFDNSNFIKLGYGNFKTPFLQAGASLGDGKTGGLNIFAKHVSSKGKLAYQDYSNTDVDMTGFYKSGNNLEWNGRFGGTADRYKKYGFEPRTLTFSNDDSLQIKYNGFHGGISFHNVQPTSLGITYAPEIKFYTFNNTVRSRESDLYIDVPLHKAVGEGFGVDVGLTANLAAYKNRRDNKITNNFFYVSPSLTYKKDAIDLQAGLRPSWDNSNFKLLPNVLAEFRLKELKFSFQAGYTGYLRYSGYQYNAAFNPYIYAPDTVTNTRIEEVYAGFKGAVGDHVSYSAKIGYNKLRNGPLFVNSSGDGKSFIVLNEPDLKVITLGGELGYTLGEKFSLIANVAFNNYNPKVADKAWGLLPMEFTAKARVQVLKDLYANATFYAFDGAQAFTDAGRKKGKGAGDLSAGMEFGIVKNIKLWAQFNNITNSQYQRWNQYPVYGFNFLAGVVFSFDQKN